MFYQIKQETVEAGAKVAPALGGAGYTALGLPLADWVAIITMIYVLLQIGLLVPKYKSLLFGKNKKDV